MAAQASSQALLNAHLTSAPVAPTTSCPRRLSCSADVSFFSHTRATLPAISSAPFNRPSGVCDAASSAGNRRSDCRSATSAGRKVTASATTGSDVDAAPSVSSVDVSSTCVSPVFRSFPQPQEEEEEGAAVRPVRVLFLSEGNVCRSVYAEAIFAAMLADRGLAQEITCDSKGVRDYNIGEQPDSRAVQVAEQSGVRVDADRAAQQLMPALDVVTYDLLVVMDKFNAADVLKEVSVFDTIDPSARFSAKVRRLGDFCKSRVVEDIDDPLYGNMGGPEELDLLSDVLTDIQDCCHGLLEDLLSVRASLAEGESMRAGVGKWLQGMDDMDWLVPPMLQKKRT